MKKIICIAVFKILFLACGNAQSNARPKFVIPAYHQASLITATPSVNPACSFGNFTIAEEPGNKMLIFLNNEPFLKFKATPKKIILVSAQLSFTDLVENTINSVKDGLLNKYDDHITELFRDAPSLVSLKCSIGF